jgi:hypothetical protein
MNAQVLKSRHDRRLWSRRGQGRPLRASREIDEKVRRLAELLKEHDRNCWKIGDLVAELLNRHRCSLGMLAQFTGRSKSRLSECHLNAVAFAPHQRERCTFEECNIARRIKRRFRTLDMTLLEIRDEIRRLGLRRHKTARAYFVRILTTQEENASVAESAQVAAQGRGIIGRCHLGDYREVVPRLPDGAVKLFIADPPFGAYNWQSNGAYASIRQDANGLRNECDFDTAEESLEVTLDLFKVCLPKLAPGGCMVLFQPGNKPDRPEVLAAAKSNGWRCAYALTWHKALKETGSPCDCSEPYAIASERLLIFAQDGDQLQWHEPGLSRSDVIVMPSETQGATVKMEKGDLAFGGIHMFQKPIALMEFLVRKHSFPGELVVEPFGCSGSGAIAAATLGRRWVYVESNRGNFVWGSRRVLQAAANRSSAPG